ncbi:MULTISPECIES: hypothetical protein [Brevibacillus]|jgi:hypothetical protein|uniref:hypothetical protein n=1 Tax=Brevibacillus TaxID=55080 RepID=UPI00156B525F|nr:MULTISPECIES: hypothetical protein [Brevibacillus]NRQ52931.1 hypothetical protein [Brevibacillus sp. HD1.4A]
MSIERLNITIHPYEKPSSDGQSIINIFDTIKLEPNEERISFNVAISTNYIGYSSRYLVGAYLIRNDRGSKKTSFSPLTHFLVPDEEINVPSEKRQIMNVLHHVTLENIKMDKGFYLIRAYAIDVKEEAELDINKLIQKHFSKEKLKNMFDTENNLMSVTNFEIV